MKVNDNYPLKVQALIEEYTLNNFDDTSDLEVEYNGEDTVTIGNETFKVYTEEEFEELRINYESILEDQMVIDYDIPNFIVSYINWNKYWEDYPLEDDVVIEGIQEIFMFGKTFFYVSE